MRQDDFRHQCNSMFKALNLVCLCFSMWRTELISASLRLAWAQAENLQNLSRWFWIMFKQYWPGLGDARIFFACVGLCPKEGNVKNVSHLLTLCYLHCIRQKSWEKDKHRQVSHVTGGPTQILVIWAHKLPSSRQTEAGIFALAISSDQ